MHDQQYRRFLPQDEYVKHFEDRGEVVPPFIVGQPYVVRDGVGGYLVLCEPNHPDAEEDIIARGLVEQAEEDYRGWGDSFIAGLGEMHSPYLALREFVGRVERIEPDPYDFDSAAPYRQPSYANACRYLGIGTKYNRGKGTQVSR